MSFILYFLLYRTTSTPMRARQCKTVIEKKLFRVLIHEKPMDPVLSAFKSPDFPKLKPNKTIKCEWDVTGLTGKKYWVDVLKQFLTPNSSDTANCLYIRRKGSTCAGRVIPVLTKSNRLFMRMTLDSGQFDAIQGGLHGFYIEYDPMAMHRPLYLAPAREYPCKRQNNVTCYELSCESTDPGPDLRVKPLILTPSQSSSPRFFQLQYIKC